MATSSRQVTPKQAAAYQRKVKLEDLRMRLRAKTFEMEEAKDDVDVRRDKWHELVQHCRNVEAELRAAMADCDTARDRFESDRDELARLTEEKKDLERQLTALERQ